MEYQPPSFGQQPQQPYGQPQPGQTIPVVVAAPPKKKNRLILWIGVVLAALTVMCCGAIGINAAGSDNGTKVKQPAAGLATTKSVAPSPTSEQAADVAEPTEEPTEDAAETMNMKLGTTITVTTDDGTVEVTVSKQTKYKSPRTTACQQYMPKPDNGYYLVFNVKMEVVSGTGSINPLYFTHVDPDGGTSEAIGGMFSGCGKPLDSGNDMRAGTKRSGQLVFDSASTKGAVEFGGSFFGGTQASWKIG